MITGVSGLNDPYEQLISSIIQIEREPQRALQASRGENQRFKGVLKEFDSKLSALHSQLKSLSDPFRTSFDSRSAQGLDSDAFSVTAEDGAALGAHTISVERLATTDTRISKQMDQSGGGLRTFFDANGAQTFSVEVASPTDADPDNRVALSVTVDPTGTTDGAILDEVRTAINTAMSDAAEQGTIQSTEAAQASLVNETSSTTRLSLRSGQTGYTNRLSFTDSADGLLGTLGITNNAVASGTDGGQVYAVGTSMQDSSLSSAFKLDGLTLYRDTNQVTDALDSITLNLKRADSTATSFSIAADTGRVKDDIQSFIDRYNGVLGYIETKSAVDGEAGTRGVFAGERSFTNLRFGMRTDVAQNVSGQPEGTPQNLRDLGIEIARDGTLSLADEEKLQAAVERDASAVERLISGDNGIANRLKTRLDRYVKVGGVIDNRLDGVDERTRRLDNQIKTWDERLTRREDQLREEFSQLQSIMARFQSQQNMIGGFYF